MVGKIADRFDGQGVDLLLVVGIEINAKDEVTPCGAKGVAVFLEVVGVLFEHIFFDFGQHHGVRTGLAHTLGHLIHGVGQLHATVGGAIVLELEAEAFRGQLLRIAADTYAIRAA